MRLAPARALLLTGFFCASFAACGDDDSGSGPSGAAGTGGKDATGGKAGNTGTKGGTGGTGGSASGTGGTGGKGGATGKAGEGGASGKGGGAGTTSAGAAGTTSAGAAGTTSAGAAGNTSAGAAGTTSAGAAGTTSAGAAGNTSAGAAGNTSAGAAGNTNAGAAGEAGASAAGAAGEGGAGGSAAGQAGVAGSGGAGGDPCLTLTLLQAEAVFGNGPDVSALTAPFGESTADVVRLRFATAPVKTTYTLSKAEDLAMTPALVVALQDIDTATNASKVFYVAVAGTVTVSEVVSKAQTKGALANIELREATEVAGQAVYLAGGRCLRIPAAAWDTTLSCYDATNCGVGDSCDPETRKCSPQCAGGSPVACGSDEYCGEQAAAGGSVVGACYGTCKTSVGGSCDGDTQTCVQRNLGGDGYCVGVAQTPAREGDPCFGATATFNTCEVGTLCVDDNLGDASAGICRKTCKPLSGGCPASQVCGTDGTCRASPRKFDTQVAENGFCAAGKSDCLLEAGAAKGACTAGNVCERVVFGQGQCASGTYLPFDNSAGYCF